MSLRPDRLVVWHGEPPAGSGVDLEMARQEVAAFSVWAAPNTGLLLLVLPAGVVSTWMLLLPLAYGLGQVAAFLALAVVVSGLLVWGCVATRVAATYHLHLVAPEGTVVAWTNHRPDVRRIMGRLGIHSDVEFP